MLTSCGLLTRSTSKRAASGQSGHDEVNEHFVFLPVGNRSAW